MSLRPKSAGCRKLYSARCRKLYLTFTFSIKGQGDGPVVKSTYWASRGPEFSSCHARQVPHTPKALLRGTRYLHTCTLILTQTIKINNIFKCCFSDILFISGGGEHVCEMWGRVGVSSLLRVKLRSAVHRGVLLLSWASPEPSICL